MARATKFGSVLVGRREEAGGGGQSGTAEHYLAAVVERAAALGTALAATAGLLASPDDED